MLVLSRKINEKLVFPGINVSIQILASRPGNVRLGIQAPDDVKVFRDEVFDPERNQEARQSELVQPMLRDLLHQLNNKLNAGGIGLALLRRQLEMQLMGQMADTISRLEQEFAALKQSLESAENKIVESSTPSRSRRRTALLVEDDVNECELLAGFLRLAGMEVNTAHDGADALDYLRQNERPDVMLLDMILPRTDGPSTVRAIRRNPAHLGLKIFGMTGADPRRFNLPQGEGGVDHWFHKPLNPQVLLEAMTHALD